MCRRKACGAMLAWRTQIEENAPNTLKPRNLPLAQEGKMHVHCAVGGFACVLLTKRRASMQLLYVEA
jgi:hypothetical protein